MFVYYCVSINVREYQNRVILFLFFFDKIHLFVYDIIIRIRVGICESRKIALDYLMYMCKREYEQICITLWTRRSNNTNQSPANTIAVYYNRKFSSHKNRIDNDQLLMNIGCIALCTIPGQMCTCDVYIFFGVRV